MHTLTVTRIIRAPIDDVFEAYADHEKLAGVFGVRSCTLVKEGETEKNGRGAVRDVDCGPIQFREEMTGFDRPRRIEYRIRQARPPAVHDYGQVDFIEVPEGTKVTWTTRFGLDAPGVGRVVDPVFGIGFGVAFRLVLRDVERRAVAMKGANS